MTRKVTVRNWWRWMLRGLVVVALVIGGVLPFIQPIANENLAYSWLQQGRDRRML
jgi:hypothetical protein